MQKQDLSVNLIKGFAILLVIVFHATIDQSLKIGSVLWLEQGVPLFLFCTAFLIFKQLGSQQHPASPTLRKTWQTTKKLFVPFLIFELLVVAASVANGSFSFRDFVLNAGIGMGSYYPWLYIQFWFVLPLAYRLFRKTDASPWIAIAAAALIEIAFTLAAYLFFPKHLDDATWRLFAGRYAFIMYAAYLLATDRLSPRAMAVGLVLSVAFIVISRYRLVDLFPFFYLHSSFAWNGFHWPMYIYSGFVFLVLYNGLPKLGVPLTSALGWLGRNSWLVFLGQMLFFAAFLKAWIPTSNRHVTTVLFTLLAILFSVLAAQAYVLISSRSRRYSESKIGLN